MVKVNREIAEILASGRIEEYCLGLLTAEECLVLEKFAEIHPEIRTEIEETRLALDRFSESIEKRPSHSLKEKIFQTLFTNGSDEVEQLSRSQFISKHSDLSFWKEKAAAIKDPGIRSNIHLEPLWLEGKTEQYVAWVKNNVDDEVHEDMVESFLILEGTCRCFLDDEVLDLKPGDFLEIPLRTHHNLTVTSDQNVKAVLQRIRF